jgi:hypothetical protein
MPLDETIDEGQAGHITDHETIHAQLNALGSGTTGVLKDFALVDRSSGDLTLNNTSWTDTGLADLTLSAASGDYIEVGLSALVTGDTNGFLDVASIVSAAPVNYWSGGAGGASSQGILAWRHESGINLPLGGSVMRVLAAGDVSGGNVVLRLRYRTNTAVNLTLQANTNIRLQFWAKNIGPAL